MLQPFKSLRQLKKVAPKSPQKAPIKALRFRRASDQEIKSAVQAVVTRNKQALLALRDR